VFAIGWRPRSAAVSFHGRDLFAPVAAMLARGGRWAAKLKKKARLAASFGAQDLAEIIYVDHYGNLVSGLRAAGISRDRGFVVNGREIRYARVFCEVPAGQVFWYENSLGLVEIAAGSASARQILGAASGTRLA